MATTINIVVNNWKKSEVWYRIYMHIHVGSMAQWLSTVRFKRKIL